MTTLSSLLIALALTLTTADAGPRSTKPARPTAGPRDSAPPRKPSTAPTPRPAPAPARPTPSRSTPPPARTPGRPVPQAEPAPSRQPQPVRQPAPASPRDGLPAAVGGDPLGASPRAHDAPPRTPAASTRFTPTGAPVSTLGHHPTRIPVAGAEPPDPVAPIQQGYQTRDHRYGRPHYAHVHDCPHAAYGTPYRYTYRPYYTRWYVHPYYRWQYSTYIIVHTGYGGYAWVESWVPDHRPGWMWVPGFWSNQYWNPGYWAPVAPVPVHYRYVPGYWDRELYVEGYYRSEERDDGDWEWIDGQYLEDGSYVPGHWRPTEPGPEGYTWEAGFWDGEAYVDGFWRPMYRDGFSWQGAYFDATGVYHSGFWEPVGAADGQVWVPGWFDGNAWQDGYFVPDEVYYAANPSEWDEAPEGWDAGWDVGNGWGDGEVIERHDLDAPEAVEVSPDTQRLGIPVE